ncbi:hypothetical protein [Microcystis aeruginosa]|uniref:hypothetical protein n=1 Tax=Microcystis aeruginosa TaxID=1126 RepID=UPI0011AEA988|nr:hypothetical protein [Microcystis aeruginosa]
MKNFSPPEMKEVSFPTPHTLHPTPYTLHPTHHTPHPTPHTPHPTPHFPLYFNLTAIIAKL